MELARVIWKRWSLLPPLSRSKGRLRLRKRVWIKRSQNLPFHLPKFFFSSNRRGKIVYSNKCSLSSESHIPECFFWSSISPFFRMRLCRSKRLNYKNLLKILVSVDFKFDKANMTRKYPTYTTWLWYCYSCLHNSRRVVDLSDTFKSFLLAHEPSEW